MDLEATSDPTAKDVAGRRARGRAPWGARRDGDRGSDAEQLRHHRDRGKQWQRLIHQQDQRRSAALSRRAPANTCCARRGVARPPRGAPAAPRRVRGVTARPRPEPSTGKRCVIRIVPAGSPHPPAARSMPGCSITGSTANPTATYATAPVRAATPRQNDGRSHRVAGRARGRKAAPEAPPLDPGRAVATASTLGLGHRRRIAPDTPAPRAPRPGSGAAAPRRRNAPDLREAPARIPLRAPRTRASGPLAGRSSRQALLQAQRGCGRSQVFIVFSGTSCSSARSL